MTVKPFLTEGRLSTVAVIVTLIGLVAWSSWGIAHRVAELRPQPRRCFVEALRGGGGTVTWCEPIPASTAKVQP